MNLPPRKLNRFHPGLAGGLLALAILVGVLGCSKIGANLEGPLPAMENRPVSHAESVDADQWPSWRGGAHQGISPSTSLPLTFSAHHQVRWKTPLAGEGNSSPIVFGDLVFLTRSLGEGHRAQLEVFAIDVEGGTEVWKQGVGRPVGNTHQRNGYASATMATDGTHLLACFGAKGLFCFSLEGQRLWHRPFTGADHEWGAASSPVIAGGMAIQLVDCETESFLAAYEIATGNQRWKTPRNSDGCWTSPVVAQIADRWQIVVNGSGSRDGSSGRITGYDLASGRQVWEVSGTSDIACPTAIVGEGLIVSASGSNGPILALDTQDQQPTLRWRLASGGAYVPTGLIYRERLYLVDDNGILSCLDPHDGTEIWKGRLGATVSASLVAGAGRIYVAAESGDVFVIAAADEFQILSKNSLGERIQSTPAIVGDSLLIRGEAHLFCFADEDQQEERSRADQGVIDAAAEATAPSPSDAPIPSDDSVSS